MPKEPLTPDAERDEETSEDTYTEAEKPEASGSARALWPRLVTEPRLVNDSLLAQSRDEAGRASDPRARSVETPTHDGGKADPGSTQEEPGYFPWGGESPASAEEPETHERASTDSNHGSGRGESYVDDDGAIDDQSSGEYPSTAPLYRSARPSSLDDDMRIEDAEFIEVLDDVAEVIEVGVLPEVHGLLSGIQADRDVEACAKALADGSPVHVVGEMDAETNCAVVAMAGGNLAEIGAILGIGEVCSWSIGSASTSWYVHSGDDGVVVAIGKPQKSTVVTLQRLFTKLNSERGQP